MLTFFRLPTPQVRSLRAKRCLGGGVLVLAYSGLFSLACATPVVVRVSAPDGKPVANAVVSIYVKGVSGHAAAGKSATMEQRGKQFLPMVLAIQQGTAVSFPNHDTVRHNVYSFSPIKPIDLKLYVGTPSTPVVFDKPGTAVLGCNIHDNMTAQIHVVATPYFALTDGTGYAQLDVPVGQHNLRLWYPTMPSDMEPQSQPITVRTSATELNLRTASP